MKITKEKLKQLIKEEIDALGEGSFPTYFSIYDSAGKTTGSRLNDDNYVNISGPDEQPKLIMVASLVEYAKAGLEGRSANFTPTVYTIQKGQIMSMDSDEYRSTPLGKMQARYATEE